MRTTQAVCLAALVAVCCLCVAAGASAAGDLKIEGYTQFRYVDTSLTDDDYDFDVKRSRIRLSGPVNDTGTEIVLQVDLGPLDDNGDDDNVDLVDAYISHALNPEWKLRAGFSTPMFGFDGGYSNAKRMPFERAVVTGMFLPGLKDAGLYATYSPKSGSAGTPSVILGITNDVEDTADWFDEHDESMAFVGGLRWALPNKGEAGLSYMSSNREGTIGGLATEWDDHVWGAHVRYNSNSNLAFQGEYMDGDRQEVGVRGWYGLLEFTPSSSDAALFYRYDTYDDGDADDYARHTVGVAMEVGSQSRVTLQYEDIDNEGVDGSNLGIQWQVSYPAK